MAKSASSKSSSASASQKVIKCMYCKRKKGTPNPIKKGRQAASAELSFHSERPVCSICRNFFNRTKAPASERTSIQNAAEGSEAHTTYMGRIDKYQHDINTSENGYVTGAAREPDSNPRTEAIDEALIEGNQNLGVFWPTAIYERRKKKKVPDGKQTTWEGKKGIILSDDECPVGCTRLSKVRRTGARMATEVAGGDDYGMGIAAKQFKTMNDRLTPTITDQAADDETDGIVMKLAKAKLQRRGSDSSSEVDWLNGAGSSFGASSLLGVGGKVSKSDKPGKPARTADGDPGVVPPGGNSKAQKKFGQLLKDVQTVEDLNGKIKNIMEQAASSFKSLLPNVLLALQSVVQKKIESSSIETLVIADTIPDAEGDGDQPYNKICIASQHTPSVSIYLPI